VLGPVNKAIGLDTAWDPQSNQRRLSSNHAWFVADWRTVTSVKVVYELSASSSADDYAAASMAITSSGSSAGGVSALAIESALM
jgi:hypothetical protein